MCSLDSACRNFQVVVLTLPADSVAGPLMVHSASVFCEAQVLAGSNSSTRLRLSLCRRKYGALLGQQGLSVVSTAGVVGDVLRTGGALTEQMAVLAGIPAPRSGFGILKRRCLRIFELTKPKFYSRLSSERHRSEKPTEMATRKGARLSFNVSPHSTYVLEQLGVFRRMPNEIYAPTC